MKVYIKKKKSAVCIHVGLDVSVEEKNEPVICALLPPQSAKQDSINITGMCSALAMPTPPTHISSILLFCIIWLPMLQGKAGLIEVISIIVMVDGKGNKNQGPFLHGFMRAYVRKPGFY